MWYYKEETDEHGRKVFVATNICTVCFDEYRSNSPASSKYCPVCAQSVQREKNRNRVRKFRERNKKAVTDDHI